MSQSQPTTLGELKRSGWKGRVSVKEEMRRNLLRKLAGGEALFPGILGYEDSVIPQMVNAILSRHNMILLGLRGQAKSRLLRSLTTLLDPLTPAVAGSEINDDPLRPLSKQARDLIAERGDETSLVWLSPEQRYVEKLATPDVTIADIIGDVDPIRAARGGHDLASELTMHYGLLPRAHRGIFALNELPDLAGRIQVGLFNILQEGDVQIKGYPVRLPIDVCMVFTANPEDYTARGKIITPLKDRIGSEIRTHYPATLQQGVAITALENTISNAERRALRARETPIVPRVSDIYAALPSLTGKFELEYEGELMGAENVARELIREAVGEAFSVYLGSVNFRPVVAFFENGGSLKIRDDSSSSEVVAQLKRVPEVFESLGPLGVSPSDPAPALASAGEFILEGLYAQKKIGRSDDRGFVAPERRADNDMDLERLERLRKMKKQVN